MGQDQLRKDTPTIRQYRIIRFKSNKKRQYKTILDKITQDKTKQDNTTQEQIRQHTNRQYNIRQHLKVWDNIRQVIRQCNTIQNKTNQYYTVDGNLWSHQNRITQDKTRHGNVMQYETIQSKTRQETKQCKTTQDNNTK